MKKLPDEIACRNLIRGNRKRMRETCRFKGLVLLLDIVDGYKLSIGLQVSFKSTTKHISLSHYILFKGERVGAKKYQKLSCKTKHGIEALRKQREMMRIANNRHRTKYLYTRLENIEDVASLANLVRIMDNESINSMIDIYVNKQTTRIY